MVDGNDKVYRVIWQDASYSFDKKMPSLPHLQETFGIIVDKNDEFINIATNLRLDRISNKLEPSDGFLIPKKVIIKYEEIL